MTMRKKRQTKDPVYRVLARVTISRLGCWESGLRPGQTGYIPIVDRTGDGARQTSAHRIMYEHFNGQIPNDLVIDHLCRNRICVNPDHMEVVTRAENSSRGGGAIQRAKTHCPRNHPYEGENLFINANGRRECRTCRSVPNRRGRAEL